MQTILGANGTIGALLAKELKAFTDQIRLVSRNPKKIHASDELLPADLTDPNQVEKAVAGSKIVYLVVGFDYKLKIWQDKWPKLMHATINACIKHNARLVFFDNVYLYDVSAIGHMTEESIVNPPSKKGKVRRQIAEMLMDAVKAGNLNAQIVRSADFYGPGNEKSILIEMVYKNIKKGKRPNWLLDANKKHSFTYTPDAAKATAVLGNTEDAYNQVWHLPTDKNALTGNEMVSLFNKQMNGSKKVMALPMFLLRILGIFVPIMREMCEMVYQYNRDYIFDSSKFENRFHIKPTTYSEGVKEIVVSETK
ncbi:MAG TPA: NAD-dependent epimerase/dehydratase family protein [Puia sp.]|nr:NAD-dependent epimerase/dehydratase family protein [Puia sp.]